MWGNTLANNAAKALGGGERGPARRPVPAARSVGYRNRRVHRAFRNRQVKSSLHIFSTCVSRMSFNRVRILIDPLTG